MPSRESIENSNGKRVGVDGLMLLLAHASLQARLDAVLCQRRRPHGFGWSMVKKPAKSLFAEGLVWPCEKNKFMPGDINNLRWHCNHSSLCLVANIEIIPEPFYDQVNLILSEVRIFFLDLFADR